MQNYFQLLGVEERFTLDASTLNKAYMAAQQRFHPDRLVGKSDAERADSVQRSMDTNDAYETLKTPLGRAEHLLALDGIIVNQDELDTHHPSQDLLMEVLELRESLAESQSEPEVAKHILDIKAAMRETEEQLMELFEQESPTKAAQATIRLRYLGKTLEEAMGLQYRLKAVS